MTLEATLLAWSALALAVTLAPGPDTLLVMGHAGRGGVRAGLAAAMGVVAGGLWYVALCGFGFLGVLSASDTLYAIVKWAGAAYLAWIGLGMLRGAVRPSVAAGTPPALGAPFRQGLLTNILNPKVALFYLAALPQFAGNGPDAPWIGALLVAIHYAIGAVWLSAVAIGAGRAGQALRHTRAMRWVEGATGFVLIGLAGRLVIDRK